MLVAYQEQGNEPGSETWLPSVVLGGGLDSSESDAILQKWIITPVSSDCGRIVIIFTAGPVSLSLTACITEVNDSVPKVELSPLNPQARNQHWRMSTGGTIAAVTDPTLLLTMLSVPSASSSSSRGTLTLARRIARNSPLVAAQMWLVRGSGFADPTWRGQLGWPVNTKTGTLDIDQAVMAQGVALVVGVAHPPRSQPPRMAVEESEALSHVDVRVARNGDSRPDAVAIFKLRVLRRASVDDVLAAASRTLGLSTPARAFYTVLGQLVARGASNQTADSQRAATTAPWMSIPENLREAPVLYVAVSGERFVPVDTPLAKSLRREKKTAVERMRAELNLLQGWMARHFGDGSRAIPNNNFSASAVTACREVGLCTAVVFGLEKVEQPAANDNNECVACATAAAAAPLQEKSTRDFACIQGVNLESTVLEASNVHLPLSARIRLSATDFALSEKRVSSFSQAVEEASLALEPSAREVPETPTPTLATKPPYRFNVFPEGLYDRKYSRAESKV